MKNFVKYALASMAVMGLAACNENDEWTNPSVNNNGEGYMSLSIEMPNVGTGTRAIDETGDKNPGLLGEQTISTIDVWIFDATNVSKAQKQSFLGTQLVPTAPNPVKPSETTTYTLPAFKVEGLGKKEVVVIVNPLAQKFDNVSNADALQNEMTLTPEEISAISTTDKFMMTNANTQTGKNGAIPVEVTADHNKNNPAVVAVEVERVVAKIEDLSATYEFNVTNGTSNDKVTFNEVALINGNTKFFPIKKITANAGASNNDYIVDPNFQNQNQATTLDFYANQFASFPTKDGKLVQDLSTQTRACFYTLENTMTENEQMNAYTTGLYYKATYVLNGTTGGHIFQYGGKLYKWADFEKTAQANGVDLATLKLTEASSQADFEKINVKKYENGVCYYPFWIRHINNNQPEMGPMEFAVVRNNYYQMNIKSVKGIGEHKPTTPDPNTPDEQQESFLNVTVKVLPWIVRKNNIDF